MVPKSTVFFLGERGFLTFGKVNGAKSTVFLEKKTKKIQRKIGAKIERFSGRGGGSDLKLAFSQIWNKAGVIPTGSERLTAVARVADPTATVWRGDFGLPPEEQGVTIGSGTKKRNGTKKQTFGTKQKTTNGTTKTTSGQKKRTNGTKNKHA